MLDEQIYDEDIPVELAIKEAKTLFGSYQFYHELVNTAEGDFEYGYSADGIYDFRENRKVSDDEVIETVGEEDIFKAIEELIYDNKYAPRYIWRLEEFDSSIDEVAQRLFGISGKEAYQMIEDVNSDIQNEGLDVMKDSSKTADSASTRFMKKLGYEGIDVRGYKGLDNTTYGSVIYDLKGKDLEQKIANGARYSIKVDTALDSIFGFDDDTQTASILEEGMNALKGTEVNQSNINKLVAKIKKDTGSKIKSEVLSSDLAKVFAYMQNQEFVNYEDMMRIMTEVARPVIDMAETKVGEEEYKAFVNRLKGTAIKLTPQQMSEVKNIFGSYGEFRRHMMPLNISEKGGTTLDQMWSEIVEASGYVLDYDTNVGDQPAALYDVLQAMRPTTENTYGGNADDVAKDLAMRIVEDYFNIAGATDATNKMREQIATERKELKEQYNQRMKDLRTAGRMAEGKAVAQIKAKNKRQAAEAKNRRLATQEKNKVKKNANELMNKLLKPSDKKHVPSSMQSMVLDFLYSLDFVEPELKQNKDGNGIPMLSIMKHQVLMNTDSG